MMRDISGGSAPLDPGSTVLLTGASGFIGKHTARALLKAGLKVRCLVRPTSDRTGLPHSVQIAVGHLLDYDSLRKALAGCDGIVHIAGAIRAKRIRDFYLINRDGTANLVRAAGESAVRRFVLCSSQAAGGPPSGSAPRRPEEPPAPITEYGRSKLAGEEALRNGAGDMWWSILRPPAVYGPYDLAFLPLIKIIKSGFFIRLGAGTRFSVIYGSDIAEAIVLALNADVPSGAVWYATEGRDYTDTEFAIIAGKVMQVRPRKIVIPLPVANLVGGFNERLAPFMGKVPFLTRDKLIELTQPNYTCDDTTFRSATGFMPQKDLIQGLTETIAWYQRSGLL